MLSGTIGDFADSGLKLNSEQRDAEILASKPTSSYCFYGKLAGHHYEFAFDSHRELRQPNGVRLRRQLCRDYGDKNGC
jgi:hypothetical protein